MAFLSVGSSAPAPSSAKGGRGNHKKKSVSFSKKAGLTLSVARIRKQLRAGKYATRFGVGAPVYLAAVLEYMCTEVLELAGKAAHDNKFKRVTPRFIMLAMRNDAELNKFLGRGVHISQGGSLPAIHDSLLRKKKLPKSDDEKAAARLEREAAKEELAKTEAAEKVEKAEKAAAKKAAAVNKAASATAKKSTKLSKPTSAVAKKKKKKTSSAVPTKKTTVARPADGSIRVTRDDDEADEADEADQADQANQADYDSEADGSVIAGDGE